MPLVAPSFRLHDLPDPTHPTPEVLTPASGPNVQTVSNPSAKDQPYMPPPPTAQTTETIKPISSSKPSMSGKVPFVSLEVEVITDAMAAMLAMSLLGHVLFLKNQVPLSVHIRL